MMEVIVTNEFTRMNAGPEKRPFKILTPPERSSKMVIARYSQRPRQQPATRDTDQQPDMFWRAVRVAGLFAACAFAFFSFSQRNAFQRRGGVDLGPLPTSIQRLNFVAPAAAVPAVPQLPADAKAVSAPVGPQTFALPDASNVTITEFNLAVTADFQEVGNVDLRLTAVNAAAHTYDITVKTPRREFYRQDVQLAEHIALSKNQVNGPELVVGAISGNRVYGYIAEPLRHGRRRHRRR